MPNGSYVSGRNLRMIEFLVLDVTPWCLSGTEFVVVEDWSCLDTNAIILKGTTVLTYKPRLLDRPFSGSLAGIEVRPPLLSWQQMFKNMSE